MNVAGKAAGSTIVLKRLLERDSTELLALARQPGEVHVSVPSWAGRRTVFSGRLLEQFESGVTVAVPERLGSGQMVWLDGMSGLEQYFVETCDREAEGWRMQLRSRRRAEHEPGQTP